MDLGIDGKVAVVSGGSKGLGRAVATELAAEGARVVVSARGAEALAETVDAITAAGGTAVGVVADMRVKADIRRVVATAREQLGPVEIAVFNVYGPTHGRYEQVTDDALTSAYHDMVLALHWLTEAVLPDMTAAGWGRLVTLNSISAKEVHRDLPLFTANLTRSAAVSFNKSLSAEVAPHGITVNTMGTGSFLTDRFTDYMQRQAEERGVPYSEFDAMQSDIVPVGRIGYPSEMSAAVAFLCSIRAGFITGQFLVVDGGQVRTLW
ncbi:Rossmann-fold NAD(P)-binding domain-containing protein [Jatrophihabitans fulvus]